MKNPTQSQRKDVSLQISLRLVLGFAANLLQRIVYFVVTTVTP